MDTQIVSEVLCYKPCTLYVVINTANFPSKKTVPVYIPANLKGKGNRH